MFERFTTRARQAIVAAQEEARLLGHAYIGTEHVLLALLELEGGDGVLSGLGLDKQLIEDQLMTMLASVAGEQPASAP